MFNIIGPYSSHAFVIMSEVTAATAVAMQPTINHMELTNTRFLTVCVPLVISEQLQN